MRSCTVAAALAALLVSSLPATAEDVGEATRVQRYAYQTPPQAQRAPLYRMNPVVRNGRLDTVPQGGRQLAKPADA